MSVIPHKSFPLHYYIVEKFTMRCFVKQFSYIVEFSNGNSIDFKNQWDSFIKNENDMNESKNYLFSCSPIDIIAAIKQYR